MMKEMKKSYNMNNKGSAIITALVVSTVLMVLCLSLLLIAHSLFSNTVSKTSDFPQRELIYSTAEEIEKELTSVVCNYTTDSEVENFFKDNDSVLWNYLRFNLWQGFDKDPLNDNKYFQLVNSNDLISGKLWLYYDKNSSDGYHNNLELCSKYYKLDTVLETGNKIVVQFYWELPEGWDGDINNKNNTILHAIYRMYGDKDEVLSKVEKVYKLDCGMIEPVQINKKNLYIYLNSYNNYDISLPDISYEDEFGIAEGSTIPNRVKNAMNDLVPNGYYVFGWYTSIEDINKIENGEDAVAWNINSDLVTDDLRLYAFCKPLSFTVTFNIGNKDIYGNDVSVTSGIIQNQSVVYNTKASSVTKPAASRHYFEDWYTSPNFAPESKWSFDTLVTDNINLYAKWIPKEYCFVSFHYNDGLANDLIEKIEIEKGTTVAKPSNPVSRINGNKKPVFYRWYSEQDCSDETEWEFSTKIYADLDLYASWTSESLAVFHVNNNLIELDDYPVVIGKSPAKVNRIDDLIDPLGYFTFVNWYSDSECTSLFNFNKAYPHQNVDIYAKWKRIAYKVTFDLNGHQGWDVENVGIKKLIDGYPVQINSTISKPSDPVFESYAFEGWYTDQACTDEYIWNFENKITDRDITLYAKWTPVDYTITYHNIEDADNSNNTISSFTIESGNISVHPANKDGYEFKGWYDNENPGESDIPITLISKGTDHNVDLYANWQAITYTITYENLFDADNSANTKSSFIVEDEIELKDPIRDGYNFKGWYEDIGLSKPISAISKGTTKNITVYAKWEVITYNITYIDTMGFSNPNPITYTIADTRKPGGFKFVGLNDSNGYFQFLRWKNDSTPAETVDGLLPGTTGDKTIYADWKRLKYDVIYLNCDDQVTGLTPTCYYVEDGLVLPTPTRTGSVFMGWYENDATGLPISSIPANSTGDKSFWADWETQKELVVFNENGHGTLSDEQKYRSIDYGTCISELDITCQGYTFGGWYTDKECSANKKWDFNTPITSDLNLYAKWTIEQYTITFIDGEEVVSTQTKDFNTKLDVPQEIIKDGFNFAGWYTDPAYPENTKWVFETDVVRGDTTLYAKWTQKIIVQFTIGNGPTSVSGMPENQYLDKGSKANKPANPVDDTGCYTFDGWFYGNTQWNFNNVVNDSITLIAHWKRVLYRVTFDSMGGTPIDPINVTYNNKIKKPNPDPVKDGFKFSGWYDKNGKVFSFYNNGNSQSNITSDITLYAHWEEMKYTVVFNENVPPSIVILVFSYDYYMTDVPDTINNLNYMDLIPEPTGDYSIYGTWGILSYPLGSGNLKEYYFTGWYKDDSFTELWDFANDRVQGTDSTITLYAGWVDKATVQGYPYPSNITNAQISEFTKWYSRLTTNQRKNFGTEEIALKYWYNHIREDDSSNNQALATPNYAPVTYMLNDEQYYRSVTVSETAPNDPPEDSDNIGESDDDEESNDPIFTVAEEYSKYDQVYNPYNNTINPRELWSWKKIS